VGPSDSGSLEEVPTLVRDPQPKEFEALLERRRQLGQDRYDEVWDGIYVMNPAPSYEYQRLAQQLAVLLDPLAREAGLEAVAAGVNLGDENSYRIPDASLHRRGSGGTYVSSAALVVEIRSPGDDADQKIPFYAERGVDEVLIVDPRKRQVESLGLRPDGGYEPISRSRLIEAGPDGVADRLDWPG
jgi:Uma2 family endonuclease